MRAAAFGVAGALLALQATAGDRPELGLPALCELGAECFLQQYVDTDPGPGARDFTCNGLSYDGHKGTDLALPSLVAMRAGVPVIAAAPGTVRGVRDGMEDVPFTPEMAAALDGRDCGNGVVIDHGGGWETQYCHLRKGSVSVRKGQEVARGDQLGLIGLSGRTQFPHVHISVRHQGATVDPFDPDGEIDCAAPSADTMWLEPPAYRPGGLIAAGFAPGVPEFDAVRAGEAGSATLGAASEALVIWAYAFGGRAGDVLRLSFEGPSGARFDHDAPLDRTQAQLFRAGGKRVPKTGWPAGAYAGTVEMLRDGRVIDRMQTQVTID